ncbi:MAG: sugar-binding protein, partial [Candidatus Cryptobacteroides sp.]
MKRNKFIQIVSALSAVAVFLSGTLSCSDDDGAGETRTVEVVRAKKPFKVFGFDGQCRYSYCPSAVLNEDGSVHLFFCGNPEQHIMVDNIYHIVLDRNGNYSSVSDVLQPGASGSWDDHHTCDPSIVQGEFRWDNETYKYAMFFLGNRYGVYYNEVGVAFSNDLNSSSWRKWPDQIVRKTWTEDGHQAIGGTGKSWGVGQP